jgi:hypothetical protein
VVSLAWATARRQTTITLPWRSQDFPRLGQCDDALRPECGFQRRDRAGPFGGQELCRLPAGALQLQGMLKRVDAVLGSPDIGRLAGCSVVVRIA